MKTIALIGLIIVATAGAAIAADTLMTIQTNTTIRIDPTTGQIKGDAQTQVRGIRKHHEVPDVANTSTAGPASTDTSAATAPVTTTTATDPNTVTAPVSTASATDPNAVTTPVGTDPATTTCPAAQASTGQ